MKLKNLQNSFFKDFIIGYSDHLEGNDACLSAVSMGAKIIEKHFTLNKTLVILEIISFHAIQDK